MRLHPNEENKITAKLDSRFYMEKNHDSQAHDFFINDSCEQWEKREKTNSTMKNKIFEKYSSKDLNVLNKNKMTTSQNHAHEYYKNDGIKNEIRLLLKEINKITKKMQDDAEEGDKALEWKFAGMVIDKLCLYLFSILTFVLTCGILLTAPNFFKFQ